MKSFNVDGPGEGIGETREITLQFRFPLNIIFREVAVPMKQQELIAKLIDLEEQVKVHSSEYLSLIRTPGNMTKASVHKRKVLRLRSRIKGLMEQIAML